MIVGLLSDAAALGLWTQHNATNCYSGHGASDLDSGHGCGVMNLADCQAKCDSLPACTAITFRAGAVDAPCYRRSNVVVSACEQDASYDTWTRSQVPPTALIPGLDDVCAHLSDSERCSPEICRMVPYQHIQLEAQTYYQDRSILLPEGVNLVGAGINKTFIVSCGLPSSGRRGFILNNNTHLGHFTWQGLQASRGGFDAAVGTPGCLDATCQGGCIPPEGDCAGVINATAEHIHNNGYADGETAWPLSTSVGWFPKTKPWGVARATGSMNITVRGLRSWGSWADGINFHGGHHNVLIEGCELSYTGDDPIGLWPVSADDEHDPNQCQKNIVIRNNIARWPRQYSNARAGATSPRDYNKCDCSDAPKGECYSHACYATYAGGRGIQWINNSCHGAFNILAFNKDFGSSSTKWCGVFAVAGNSYSQIEGQGSGCRLTNSTGTVCNNKPDPPGSVGGQCTAEEAPLPPPCGKETLFASCKAAPGVGGVCFNASGPANCITAEDCSKLAQGQDVCRGYTHACTIYD